MNLFPKAPPLFLSHNYLNRHAKKAGDLIVSSGDATKHRLYDMDPLARWQSQGSSDAVTETIEFGLYMPGARASHDVLGIFFMNHNLKSLTVESSNTNGAPWTERFNRTDLSAADKNTFIQLAGATAMDRIKATMLTTRTANEEKAIGDIIVVGDPFQAGPLFQYAPEPPRVTMKGGRMADGSLRGQLIGRSDASFHFWAARCAWILDPEDYDPTTTDFADALATFREYGLQGKRFIFMPEPGDRPEQIFYCRVRPGTYNDPYIKMSEAHGGKIGIQMVIEEIGGA